MLKPFKSFLSFAVSIQGMLRLICSSLAVVSSTAVAAQKIEIFDANSWQSFEKTLERPAIVVFSSTDCSHCPAVISSLAEQFKNPSETAQVSVQARPALIVVVMDGAMDGASGADLLKEAHYAKADRLFIFSESDAPANSTAALQYSVNPKWRGITPYVALLAQGQSSRFIMGKPSTDELAKLYPEK